MIMSKLIFCSVFLAAIWIVMVITLISYNGWSSAAIGVGGLVAGYIIGFTTKFLYRKIRPAVEVTKNLTGSGEIRKERSVYGNNGHLTDEQKKAGLDGK